MIGELPIINLVNEFWLTYFPRLTASVMAVLTRFSISAPVNPGVIIARLLDWISLDLEILSRYKSKMSYLPFTSGWGT